MRAQTSESDSGLSDDAGSAPKSQSYPAAGRPLRHRARLPVYNLKQLSGRPIRKKPTRDSSAGDDDEDIDAADGVDAVPASLDGDRGNQEYDETKPLKFCGDRPYSEWVGIQGEEDEPPASCPG